MTIVSDPSRSDEEGLRQCRKCGAWLPGTTAYFSRDKKGRDGLHYWCKPCCQESGRRYKKEHREAVLADKRRYHWENREKVLAGKRRYWQANLEKDVAYKKIYREKHREELAQNKRRYEAENPEKGVLRGYRRRSRLERASGWFTKEDLAFLYELQEGRCCWCGCEMVNRLIDNTAPRKLKFTVDHINPVARGGSNWWWNLVLACDRCNISRNSRRALSEWQPPAMLAWMDAYLLWATAMEAVWAVMLWWVKIGYVGCW